jgi:hypothetical protein
MLRRRLRRLLRRTLRSARKTAPLAAKIAHSVPGRVLKILAEFRRLIPLRTSLSTLAMQVALFLTPVLSLLLSSWMLTLTGLQTQGPLLI